MSSGVLSRGLQMQAKKQKFMVFRLDTTQQRTRWVDAETFRSKYKFHQECKKDERPPFPSSLTYDSKFDIHKRKSASKNLFWNVGK